jgi:hypothetical protein
MVQLNLTLAASVDLERVAATFASPEALWLGEQAPDGPVGIRRFSCDLELRVSPDGRVLFRKAAIVGLGEPRHDDDTWIVPIEWFAATFAPLFPAFAGELRLQTGRIGLRGEYVPPGATIGYVLDRALLGRRARHGTMVPTQGGVRSWLIRLPGLA